MSVKNKIIWSYLAQFANLSVGVAMLPMVIYYLSKPEIGIWFIFFALVGLAQIIDFAIQPGLIRQVSYVYAGAKTIQRYGMVSDVSGSTFDRVLFGSLLVASKRLYSKVAITAGLMLLVPGTAYIYFLTNKTNIQNDAVTAWILFSGGYIFVMRFGYISSFLQGMDCIRQNSKVVVLNRLLFAVLALLLFEADCGLLSIGLSNLFSAFASRLLLFRYFNEHCKPSCTYEFQTEKHDLSEITQTILVSSRQLIYVLIGSYLSHRSGVLVASAVFGLESAAAFGLVFSIMAALSGVSMAICTAQVPRMNIHQFNRNNEALTNILGESIVISLLTYTLGLMLLLVLGPHLLTRLGYGELNLEFATLVTIVIYYFLELNQNIAGTFLMTANKVPFVRAALVAGALSVPASLISIAAFGEWGVVVGPALVQMSYNNWKWPTEAAASLKTSWLRLSLVGLRRIIYRSFS